MIKIEKDVGKREAWNIYLHECVHGILADMRRWDLNNESFVNAFCRRLEEVVK